MVLVQGGRNGNKDREDMEQVHKAFPDSYRRRRDTIAEIDTYTSGLEFSRRNGKRYKWVGRESTSGGTIEYIRSMETGKVKTMTPSELEEFKTA